jgi:hypothetical protein
MSLAWAKLFRLALIGLWLSTFIGAPLILTNAQFIPSGGFGGGTGLGSGSNAGVSSIQSTLCNIYNDIKTVIFVLALALMVLGGALYGGAHIMPSSSRGSIQGYGFAMIMGGIIGLIIVLAAPFVINTVVGASGAGGFGGAPNARSLCSYP